ncbi:MAG: class I SAM-dependent methyltransferase [Afipia sp.]|nr:class I SAM-dependent methyltransferase [Afipia sp.]
MVVEAVLPPKAVQITDSAAPGERVENLPPEQTADAVEDYWTGHNVTSHRVFPSAEASLADLRWRNAQYFDYIDHMPIAGADGLSVIDFGCGPGYDLVGFATQSKPERLIGIDVSAASLVEAKARLELHDAEPELYHHDVMKEALPFADASVDLVHSSGVLHHMPSMEPALTELRRVLKPGGIAQFMIYNADSLWLHLYVAYERQLVQGLDVGLDLAAAFQKSTDGPDCPVSRCYTPQAFIDLVARHGFAFERFGAAISAWEMSLLPKRYAAIMDPALPEPSRDFLASLTFDARGLPLTRSGALAGIDGCFRFRAV